MPAEIIMPKMGDAMAEGKVVRWYKQPGDAVKKGEPVLEIETDKVNLDLEAEADGKLSDHQAKEGETVAVGGVLAQILGEGESASAPAPAPAAAAEPAAAPPERRATDKKDSVKHSTGEYGETIEAKGPRIDRTARASSGAAADPAAERPQSGRQKSSPLARKMAKEMGVPLESIQGSGPHGRIVAEDVRNAKPSGGPQPSAAPAPREKVAEGSGPPQTLESKSIPLSAMRRTIAKRLSESTGPIPHFYLTVDYDVTSLLDLRKQLNEIEEAKVSVNDFLIRAVALALRHHPNVNASFGEDAITQHGEIHIGVAVSTPEGLITPVVRNADQKSVREINVEVRALAEKAKIRKLRPDEYQGSTFTISNLGAWGIEEFTAIINPPNAAILAIGTAEPRAVVVDRQVVVRDRMKVTMSCDHRIVDGALGAEYLKTLRQYIEQPLRLVM